MHYAILCEDVRTEVSGRTLELGLDAPGTVVRPSQPISLLRA